MPRSAPDLRIPGPTPLHPEVVAAMRRPMTSYRGPEMAALLPKLLSDLSGFVGAASAPLLLTAPPRAPRGGEPADPDRLRAELARRPDTRAVLLTHCETSTGVLHPLAELIAAARGAGDALVLVDAVSSLGAVEVPVADCDVVFTGSQKAWGLPPGLAMVWTSSRAETAEATARLPRFYWDLARYREAAARGSFPSTPALPVVFAMEAGLRLLLDEGRDGVFAREGLVALGLRLVAPEPHASPTVTAAWLPDGVSWPDLARRLREEHGLVLGGGLGRLAGRVLRLGHLGWVTPEDVNRAVAAIGRGLADA